MTGSPHLRLRLRLYLCLWQHHTVSAPDSDVGSGSSKQMCSQAGSALLVGRWDRVVHSLCISEIPLNCALSGKVKLPPVSCKMLVTASW